MKGGLVAGGGELGVNCGLVLVARKFEVGCATVWPVRGFVSPSGARIG